MTLFKNVSFYRRIVQIIAFILIVYGAYIFGKEFEPAEKILPKIKPPQGQPSTSEYEKGAILWATSDQPVIDIYPPSAICRFNPKGGLFKACILHFLSENFTWQTQIKYILPHITLFILLSFLAARFWCGWICPLGFIGDILTSFRKKVGMDYKLFSPVTHKILKITRYNLFAFSILISIAVGFEMFEVCRDQLFLPYCQMCPGRLIFPVFGLSNPSWGNFSMVITSIFSILGWIFLGVFFLAFIIGKRIWCRICPIGTFSALFNTGGALEIHKDNKKCNKCGICALSCPVGSTHIYDEKTKEIVNHEECLFCLRCIEMCPRDKCLKLTFFNKKILEASFKNQR